MRFCVFWIKICRKVISLLYCMKYSEKRKKKKNTISAISSIGRFSRHCRTTKQSRLKMDPSPLFGFFEIDPSDFTPLKKTSKDLPLGKYNNWNKKEWRFDYQKIADIIDRRRYKRFMKIVDTCNMPFETSRTRRPVAAHPLLADDTQYCLMVANIGY